MSTDEKIDIALEEAITPSPTRHVGPRTWYRTTFFNISVVAACAFIAPGLWAAINGLGAGGAASPYYVNAANSVIFVLQFIICIFGSWIIARVDLKWALVMGMIGFPIYSSSLYTHVKYMNNWYLMLACVIDGALSGLFWLTEGAIVLAYPEKHKRGMYLAYWLGFRIIGQMIGGAVSLGVNVDRSERGHISVNTYLIFIAIQAVGPFVAACLSTPDKVQRSDGTPVAIKLPKSLKTELRAMWRLLGRKEILLLTPMMFQSVFSEAFFSTYNATYFTVRSRALASLVASCCVIFANFGLGFWLDWKKPSLNTRAVGAFVLIYAFEAGLYIYAMVITKEYEGMEERPIFDWVDEGFGRGVCVYILMLVGFKYVSLPNDRTIADFPASCTTTSTGSSVRSTKMAARSSDSVPLSAESKARDRPSRTASTRSIHLPCLGLWPSTCLSLLSASFRRPLWYGRSVLWMVSRFMPLCRTSSRKMRNCRLFPRLHSE